jgi:hypothetical protein
MNVSYVFIRILRKMIPRMAGEFILRRNIGMKMSLGVVDPGSVVDEYRREISRFSHDINGAAILEIGYGGSFGTAIAFLKRGARHIYLYDPFAHPFTKANRILARTEGKYLIEQKGRVIPDPGLITVLPDELDQNAFNRGQVNFILSNAVLEHVRDVGGLFDQLVVAIPDGFHAHYVDLRDHFYRYPFEMLCYSDRTWNRFLNPADQLNRMRLLEYCAVLDKRFSHSEYRITESDSEGFNRQKHRIKRHFLSGDDRVDAAKKAWIFAW